MTIRVILADDQPLVRAGLRMLIEQTPDIDVAGEAGTGAEAVHLARDADPDVVVMDIRMPGMDGIEATQMITAGDTHARVLVLTTFDDDDYVYGALRAGASGFLVKDMALEDILGAIRVEVWTPCRAHHRTALLYRAQAHRDVQMEGEITDAEPCRPRRIYRRPPAAQSALTAPAAHQDEPEERQ
jgi:DNA-binding NarL/FixJ family response regulator